MAKGKTYLEDLTTYKVEIVETQVTLELKRLIHIKEVSKTARKHSWYLKQRRQGMVDHILTPSFNVIEVSALIFFLLAPE